MLHKKRFTLFALPLVCAIIGCSEYDPVTTDTTALTDEQQTRQNELLKEIKKSSSKGFYGLKGQTASAHKELFQLANRTTQPRDGSRTVYSFVVSDEVDGSGGSLQLVVDDGTITKVLFFEAKD